MVYTDHSDRIPTQAKGRPVSQEGGHTVQHLLAAQRAALAFEPFDGVGIS